MVSSLELDRVVVELLVVTSTELDALGTTVFGCSLVRLLSNRLGVLLVSKFDCCIPESTEGLTPPFST